MRLACLVLALAAASCRAPSSLEKQTFDFAAHPGPGASTLSQESGLLASWNDPGATSLRTFWSSGQAGTFTGVDGATLPYRIHRASPQKAAVLVLPGRTEAIVKYAEVARDLVANGYSTYTLTLRGQGEASRLLSDADKGYVAFFDDYVQDTHRFVQEVMVPAGGRRFLLAHSMGGAVAVLLNDLYPSDVEALALNAPMLQIDVGSFPPPVASSLGQGFCNVSDGTGYILGAGPYTREESVENSTVTHSAARHGWKVQQLDEDASIRLGGVTWRWLCQSLEASSRAEAVGAYSEKPTVLVQASEDSIVEPAGQTRYCTDAPRCTLLQAEGARHEVLQESDALRNPVLSNLIGFFDAQVTP